MPGALWTYRLWNPWCLNKLFPFLLSRTNFLKPFTKVKQTIMSMLIDVYVQKWLNTSVYMCATFMIEHKASSSETY